MAALVGYFLRLGATGFGGPAALAEPMRRDLVETRRWISPDEYEMGLAIAAASPGPLAFQLAVFCAYIRQGVTGAIGVAVAFALAPFAVVVVVAAFYGRYAGNPALQGIFHGVGPVVVGLIARACWQLGRKTLGLNVPAWIVALTICGVSLLSGREPTLLILLAGAAGTVVFATATRAVPPHPVAPEPPVRAAAFLPLGVVTATTAGSWPLFTSSSRPAALCSAAVW